MVAGFQGVSADREITTLGRGGSDTTAVALAAAFKADSCEIYTDVTGVFSADPRIVPQARKLAHLSFDEMLEMAASGGRVLALRSVEFARNYGVPLHVRSSFTWEPGTWVTDEEPTMEDPIISGVTHDAQRGQGHDHRCAGPTGHLGGAVRAAGRRRRERRHDRAEHVQGRHHRHLLHRARRPTSGVAEEIVQRVAGEVGATGVSHDADIAKVSLIGAGMKSSPGVAAKMFRTLADRGINIEMISTSTIRTTVRGAGGGCAGGGAVAAHGVRAGQRQRLRRPPPRTQVTPRPRQRTPPGPRRAPRIRAA